MGGHSGTSAEVTLVTSVLVGTFWDLPDEVRDDCMEQLAPGVFLHHRTSVVYVIATWTSQRIGARVPQ